MGDGTEKNPYTREDVLRRIREHGGKAKGLDLSGKWLKDWIDLSELDLSGINLKKTTLAFAHLEGAFLLGAHLEAACLFGAYLEGSDLRGAHLEGTDLSSACLKGADLVGVEFPSDTRLEGVDWGDYKIGEELSEDFHIAESIYRRLKQWYTNAGIYGIAGEFFFREMEAKRKNLRWLQPKERRWLGWWPLRGEKARLHVYKWLSGYGERPWRVVAWAASVVFGLAAVYYLFGGLNLPYSLYYSAVSFTALGYGSWASAPPQNWVQGVGAAESFIGVFTIALFLITFVRKMTR